MPKRIPLFEPPPPPLYVGIASWSIPFLRGQHFPRDGSHLERYSSVFDCVEVNSSFYRHHKPQTYARWAASVPSHFRFSVKLAKVFTHTHRLKLDFELQGELESTLHGISELRDKLGVILVQLPPSLEFEPTVAERFFLRLRHLTAKPIAIEPRHATWTSPAAADLLERHALVPVWADPSPIAAYYSAESPLAGPGSGLAYARLHGAPVTYRSEYPLSRLREFELVFRQALPSGNPLWCIFDNTTFGHAISNALQFKRLALRAGGLDAPAHGLLPTEGLEQKREKKWEKKWLSTTPRRSHPKPTRNSSANSEPTRSR